MSLHFFGSGCDASRHITLYDELPWELLGELSGQPRHVAGLDDAGPDGP